MPDGEPRNETGKWLLLSGCHGGTRMSRDSGVSRHASEEEARKMFSEQQAFWAGIGHYVWYARIVPPGALYQDGITLHPGTPYA